MGHLTKPKIIEYRGYKWRIHPVGLASDRECYETYEPLKIIMYSLYRIKDDGTLEHVWDCSRLNTMQDKWMLAAKSYLLNQQVTDMNYWFLTTTIGEF